ncbi:putative membrane protein [Variovorax boronicumulans]|uniref:hypothetical protein n=1 Tax=Variovorax boronicumulans TaxID=436515 RepID=UPI0027859AAA|nr:hypothetical protein [Variovorax boronicumulans]MDP9990054.1 putative membrane protein [Variovorax boronicumulans]MDQ0001438.1 putative membrane protein [Variovorax boronicumulans]
MDSLIDVFVWLLIGIAIGPLLLLGLYAIASYFGLGIADRILALTGRFLALQWFSGGVLNAVGGIALAALGVWAVLHFDPLLHRLLAALLVPFGLWRTYLGVAVLRAISKTEDLP